MAVGHSGMYQYSVSLTGFVSKETGKTPTAYLWIPEGCQRDPKDGWLACRYNPDLQPNDGDGAKDDIFCARSEKFIFQFFPPLPHL